MSHATVRHPSSLGPWSEIYAPVATEMQAVEQLLKAELRCDTWLRGGDPYVDRLVKHAFRLGGKRLRPALLLLAAQATGKITREHVTLAAVVEMVHTATLVHDDVLDDATLRRHLPTINISYDNEASVLVGDFLFTHAFALASSLETTFAARTIGRATNIVCAGEIRQTQTRGNLALTEAEYLDIIEAKTAELCACCCRLGAHYAGASADVEEALDRFGRNLGIAFQIADDLLDVVGEEMRAGKSLGTDLKKQKMTLPLIRLLAQTPAVDRESRAAEMIDDSNKAQSTLRKRLSESDALAYTRARAEWYVQQAREELIGLPESPAVRTLRTLADLVLSRRE